MKAPLVPEPSSRDNTLIFPEKSDASVLPASLLSSGRTLAVHMYVLSQEGLHTDQAFATAVILLVMVLLINILSSVIAKKMQRD